jgi:hypothetical protein
MGSAVPDAAAWNAIVFAVGDQLGYEPRARKCLVGAVGVHHEQARRVDRFAVQAVAVAIEDDLLAVGRQLPKLSKTLLLVSR